ncbi:MAG: hypothetical protein WD768_10375 [Phycisphaeraceae bacterium]
MARGKPPRPAPGEVPNRYHVLHAVSAHFSPDEQDTVLSALERVIPLQDRGSLEYLQLVLVEMSQGQIRYLLELVEEARVDVREVYNRFLCERPFCGWPEGWWAKWT